MAAKAELPHLRRAHPPNHTPNSQRPRATATAIAAATAYGNTSLCMCRSRAACSEFVATMSDRSERVGGTGLEEHCPARKLSLGICMGAKLAKKLTAAGGRCESEQK
jgi:hypothetical protein